MNRQPPPGANLYLWILQEAQRQRDEQAERVAASVRRIEARQQLHGNAQECRPIGQHQ